MMMNFCTLFDSYYLPKGLILYDSLCKVCDDFHLYVFAFDDRCYQKLNDLQFQHMTVISLKEFETEELLKVKPTRTRAEYCWTCGASTIWYTIQRFNLDHCTYIDADLMFFHSPKFAFDEIDEKGASIALTRHFTEVENLAGQFCVQFVYFKNDKDGMQALKWWKDSCIEWCFARYENGKFGDQKYLDYFPLKFANVHVMEHRGIGVAPWNMNLYTYPDTKMLQYNGQKYPVVFFHYHGTKIDINHRKLVLHPITYDIPKVVEDCFFVPFLENYEKACKQYLNQDIDGFIIEKRSWHEQTMFFLKRILRNNLLVRFIYNLWLRFIRKIHRTRFN